ncbi:MAG: tetratricopeptide repeat protein [Acidobacteria bacterium]|nr:tetratricopeptide repeat protein [Acidobacteriota bacterium]
MFLRSGRASARIRLSSLRFFLFVPFVLLLCAPPLRAQMGTDYTGTGGKHTIKGRIFFPSGRRIDGSIKITLESITTGNLSVFADSYGGFSFTNLVGGSYTIVIEPTEYYEGIRETVVIDEGGGRYVRTVANIISVNLQLTPKRTATSKPGVVNAALASIPKEALALYDKGLEAGQAGDSKKAIEYFNGALKIHPEFALALNELGVQYLTLKQTDKAIEVLREAVRYANNEAAPHLNLGIALYSKNQIAECESELQAALQKNQKLWAAHMYLGLTRLKQRNYDDAEKELQQALTLGGDSLSLPHYYLGGIYWGRRDYKRAADELEKYLKLSPKAPDAEQTKNAIKELRSKQR